MGFVLCVEVVGVWFWPSPCRPIDFSFRFSFLTWIDRHICSLWNKNHPLGQFKNSFIFPGTSHECNKKPSGQNTFARVSCIFAVKSHPGRCCMALQWIYDSRLLGRGPTCFWSPSANVLPHAKTNHINESRCSHLAAWYGRSPPESFLVRWHRRDNCTVKVRDLGFSTLFKWKNLNQRALRGSNPPHWNGFDCVGAQLTQVRVCLVNISVTESHRDTYEHFEGQRYMGRLSLFPMFYHAQLRQTSLSTCVRLSGCE